MTFIIIFRIHCIEFFPGHHSCQPHCHFQVHRFFSFTGNVRGVQKYWTGLCVSFMLLDSLLNTNFTNCTKLSTKDGRTEDNYPVVLYSWFFCIVVDTCLTGRLRATVLLCFPRRTRNEQKYLTEKTNS